MTNLLHFPPYHFDAEAYVKVDVNAEANIAEIGFWVGERLYLRTPMQENSFMYEMESSLNLHSCVLENVVITALFPNQTEDKGMVALTATIKKEGQPDIEIDEVLAEWE